MSTTNTGGSVSRRVIGVILIVVGVVGVSNLLKWLLEHYEKATLGALLGLLLGAVVGLWPFQQPVEPALGSLVKGRVVTEERLSEIDMEDWPLERFQPGTGQVGASLGLVLVGLAATLLIAHVGRSEGEEAPEADAKDGAADT